MNHLDVANLDISQSFGLISIDSQLVTAGRNCSKQSWNLQTVDAVHLLHV